jgi:hypothetical protein
MGLVLLAAALAVAAATGFAGDREPQFVFALDQVDNDKLWLESEAGCSWEGASYGGGAFSVSKDGVMSIRMEASDSRGPSLSLRLADSGQSIEVTCAAERCAIVGPEESDVEGQTLTKGTSSTIPATPGTKFKVY